MNKSIKYCCKEFTEEVNDGQFEYCEDIEMWAINGCCGGQCFVVDEMRFCPFCGYKLVRRVIKHLNGGYQPNGRKGYQPDHGSINRSDPPDGGSGVNK